MSGIIGVTGTREAAAGQADRIGAAILARQAAGATALINGGCVGVDVLCARLAYQFGLYVVTILPADRSRVHGMIDGWTHEYEALPQGSSYRDRNARIVARCDTLLAFPAHPEDDPRSRRSGTWQTVRLARHAGVPVLTTLLGGIA